MFNGSKVTIFEDAVKVLQAGNSAHMLLQRNGVDFKLRLVGMSRNPIKRVELEKIADYVHWDINQVDWGKLQELFFHKEKTLDPPFFNLNFRHVD